jgi:tRNA G46 methylase TrmB
MQRLEEFHDYQSTWLHEEPITNLLEHASFVLNSIEDGNQVDSVYTDFSKPFDRVRHQLLLNAMYVGIEAASCM